LIITAFRNCIRTVLNLGILCALFACPVPVDAKDMSDLYTTEELIKSHYILELQTKRNFEILLSNILQSEPLSKDERKRATNIRLKMPLPLHGQHNDIMEFYAKGGEVVLPVLSVKFLHDIMLANAWLHLNGFDTRTIDYYVSMLKHKHRTEFEDAHYPKPFEALGLPSSDPYVLISTDKEVEYAYFGTTSVALGFIVAHEIAHVVYGHTIGGPRKTVKKRLEEEQKADAFAIRALSRMRLDLGALPIYLTLTLAWEQLAPGFLSPKHYEEFLENVRDHPLTAERVRAIGTEMYGNPTLYAQTLDTQALDDVRRVATNIQRLADLLERDNYLLTLSAIGIHGTLDYLQLRPIQGAPP
jgi:hypothetical protein